MKGNYRETVGLERDIAWRRYNRLHKMTGGYLELGRLDGFMRRLEKISHAEKEK